MKKAISILRKKQTFNRILPTCNLTEAINYMSTMNTEYLVVVDDNEDFVGILTEHDIARKSRFFEAPLEHTKVEEIMNSQLPFVDANDSIHYCLVLMQKFNLHYLPVFESRQFRGIISSDDIIEEILEGNAMAPELRNMDTMTVGS